MEGEADDEGSEASLKQKAPKSPLVEKWNGRSFNSWKPPMHPKSPEQMQQLKEVVSSCFLLQTLPDKEAKHILQAVKGPHHVLAGMEVIRQGMVVDDTNEGLYILERGQLSAFICAKGAEHPGELVQMYDGMGQFFGELALVFKCPRSATVIADTESTLWSLDRDSFNHLLRDRYLDIRKRCKDCITRSCPSLPAEEITTLADVMSDGMRLRAFDKGDIITRMNGALRFFESFILESGHAVSSTNDGATKRYSPGDMFGAPLQGSAREESDVVAGESPTVCAVLNIQAGQKLLAALGQLEPPRGESTPSETSAPACADRGDGGLDAAAEDEASSVRGPITNEATRVTGNRGPEAIPTGSCVAAWWTLSCGYPKSQVSCCASRHNSAETETWCEAVPVIDRDDLHN
jgi:cAMP-dependent protein kinase regulator